MIGLIDDVWLESTNVIIYKFTTGDTPDDQGYRGDEFLDEFLTEATYKGNSPDAVLKESMETRSKGLGLRGLGVANGSKGTVFRSTGT